MNDAVRIHQLEGRTFSQGTAYSPVQMMSYVIETGDGSLVVFDGGNRGDATFLLKN